MGPTPGSWRDLSGITDTRPRPAPPSPCTPTTSPYPPPSKGASVSDTYRPRPPHPHGHKGASVSSAEGYLSISDEEVSRILRHNCRELHTQRVGPERIAERLKLPTSWVVACLALDDSSPDLAPPPPPLRAKSTTWMEDGIDDRAPSPQTLQKRCSAGVRGEHQMPCSPDHPGATARRSSRKQTAFRTYRIQVELKGGS